MTCLSITPRSQVLGPAVDRTVRQFPILCNNQRLRRKGLCG
ncbi:hypothetical protein Salmuc_04383 [Salipiger mucosus DSM 16094]|uniref:Uncharacterized protein n=1 Tax=Salipiger mucosus DSM 16094 TaxID=1123237 RepID=S9QBL0_9RHOB|nr:hypothetical protein Salmuc_04383 [Salipiger mucosus DSM 16094]